jgi:hypothetical protein
MRKNLRSPRVMDQSIRDFESLRLVWSSKSVSARLAMIKTVANRSLNSSGVPGVKRVVSKKLPKGTQATFNFKTWEMEVSEDLLKSKRLTKTDMIGSNLSAPNEVGDTQNRGLANIIYHEERHAEQFFSIAKLLAMSGKSAKDISREMSIPIDIANQAVTDIVKNPLSQEEQVQANALYQNIYGSGNVRRNTILNKIASGTYTLEDYKLYRSLVEEADAFTTGDMLQDRYQKTKVSTNQRYSINSSDIVLDQGIYAFQDIPSNAQQKESNAAFSSAPSIMDISDSQLLINGKIAEGLGIINQIKSSMNQPETDLVNASVESTKQKNLVSQVER